MSKKDLEFYWMVKQVQLRLANNSTIVNTYLPMKNDAIKFNGDIATLESLMPQDLIIGTGYTLDQNVAKRNCSVYWDLNVCKIIKGFALRYGRNAFFRQVNFTQSKLNKIKLPLYYNAISNLNDACVLILEDTQYIAGDYAVNAAVLTSGMALANTFQSLTGEAGQVKSAKGVTGSAIKAVLVILQADLKVMDNDVFGITNLTFRGQYQTDRKITKNVIHNTINLLALDADTNITIENVYAINQGAKRGNYTNIDGIKALYKKSGTNIIIFSHKDPVTKLPDYVSQTIRVTALYKKSVSLTVRMVKIITETETKESATEKKSAKQPPKPIISSAEAVKPDATTPKAKAPLAPKKGVSKKVTGMVKKKK